MTQERMAAWGEFARGVLLAPIESSSLLLKSDELLRQTLEVLVDVGGALREPRRLRP